MRAPKHRYRYAPVLALVLSVGVLGGGAFALVRSFLHDAPPKPKQIVQEIKLIRPPPPPETPPPPPPPEEKVDVQEPQQEPDPTPSNEPPPGEQLGLDAEGGAGGDAFGLLGHKGGRDLLGTGGSAFKWWSGLLQNEIQQQLSSEQKTRSGTYTVELRVWVRSDGTVDHVRVTRSSGSAERDQAIEAVLARMTRVSQAPPEGWPGSATLRIVSRG